jgi:hypothetical protein
MAPVQRGFRGSKPWLGALLGAVAFSLGCGPSFMEVHLSQPVVTALPGALRIEARRVFVTDDVPTGGVREDTALAVELDVTNSGDAVYNLNVTSLSCLMEVDTSAPGETLSLPLSAGGDGTFPGAIGADTLVTKPIPLPPGKTQTIWALFFGYRYPGSDIPRRITVTLPGADGHPMRVVLADPSHGQLRWTFPAQKSQLMLGLENTTLLGGRTKGMGVSTEISVFRRLGSLRFDGGLSSTLLVQTQGALTSPTSSFAGTGLNAHLALPVLTWGAELDPRRVGFYAGGQAQVLISIDPPPPPGDMPTPHVYGTLAVEGGLDLEVGTLLAARTPFPLTATGAGLPRWFLRVGYTHWWAGGGNVDGYVSSLRLAW